MIPKTYSQNCTSQQSLANCLDQSAVNALWRVFVGTPHYALLSALSMLAPACHSVCCVTMLCDLARCMCVDQLYVYPRAPTISIFLQKQCPRLCMIFGLQLFCNCSDVRYHPFAAMCASGLQPLLQTWLPAHRSGSNSPHKTNYRVPARVKQTPWQPYIDPNLTPGDPIRPRGISYALLKQVFGFDHVRDEFLPLRHLT